MAQFEALRTQPTADGGYQVIGTVRDAFDQPLANVRVSLEDVPSQPCDSGSHTTGSRGEFCVRVQQRTGTEIALHVEETDYHSAAEAAVVLDPTEARFNLSIHLESDEFDLTGEQQPLRVQLESADQGRETYPVEVRLRDSAPNGEVRFDTTGSVSVSRNAEFSLQAEDLGAPGRAVLEAEISLSDHRLAYAERKLTLTDTVQLAFVEELGPVRPVQGFDVEISATGRAGAVDGGWVEASVGDTQVGTAKVEAGKASIEVRFQAPRRERLPLSLRYVAEQPWYRPGPVLETTIEVLPPPWWAHAPWIVLAAIAGYWIIRTWKRPGRRSAEAPAAPPTRGRPEAILIRSAPKADAWSGTVVDAHTGAPIAHAKLRIEAPGIDRATMLSVAEAGSDGRFLLAKVSKLPESARLIVTAKAHSELRQTVPPLGELSVSLIERRRYLISALTQWAKRMGKPWAAAGEPTPADVATTARQREEAETQSWAEDVELAAYGPVEPDEDKERSLVSRTPPLDRLETHKR